MPKLLALTYGSPRPLSPRVTSLNLSTFSSSWYDITRVPEYSLKRSFVNCEVGGSCCGVSNDPVSRDTSVVWVSGSRPFSCSRCLHVQKVSWRLGDPKDSHRIPLQRLEPLPQRHSIVSQNTGILFTYRLSSFTREYFTDI